MINQDDLEWLHLFQSNLALRRDWVAVGKLQGLIDHLAMAHGIGNQKDRVEVVRLLRH